MKAAFASVAFLVLTLLVILLGAGEDWGQLYPAAVVYSGALSIAFALIAVGGALTSKQLGDRQRLTTAAIAIAVLGAFMLAIVAIANALDASLG
jgi:hypothetical protein